MEQAGRPDPRAAFEAIEQAREAMGLSQAELTRAADISISTYSRLMADPKRRPFPRTLRRLRNGLNKLAEEVA